MLQDIFQTVLYSLASVSSLFILTRIMGKREISQLTFFDYVIGISIGSLSASLALDSSIGYAKGLTALIAYIAFAMLLSYISLKSYFGRKVINSEPSILIQDGQIIEKALKKTRMTMNDLLAQCRQSNAFNVSEIQVAILETSGKLSVLLKPEFQPIIRKDQNIMVPPQNFCINLIIDGKVLKQNLTYLQKDMDWLDAQLKNVNIKSKSDVLLAFVDSTNTFCYYLKTCPPSSVPNF